MRASPDRRSGTARTARSHRTASPDWPRAGCSTGCGRASDTKVVMRQRCRTWLPLPCGCGSAGCPGLAFARGDLHRFDDLRIGGAAAEVSRQVVANRLVVRIPMLVQELVRHQHETGRAEAALEGARRDERLLHIAQPVAPEVLDRHHLRAVGEGRQEQASRHGAIVYQDGTAAAHALATTLARPEKIELALQHVDQAVVRQDVGTHGFAVEQEGDGARLAHASSSSGLPALARSARNTASGVSGSSVSRTPTASSMALAIAGDTQKVETSPTPLAPYGPLSWTVSTVSLRITTGTSRRPGIL